MKETSLNRLVLATTIAVIGVAATVTPQVRPDFSGRWTSEPEVSAAPARGGAAGQRGGGGGRGGRGDMGSGWGPTITIAQDGARLTVEYAFFSRGDLQPPLRFAYALNGSETQNTVYMGRGPQLQRSRTSWNGASLAITTVHAMQDPATGKTVPAEVTQTLTLESPTSLVVETTRAGVLGAAATTTRTTYRKIG